MLTLQLYCLCCVKNLADTHALTAMLSSPCMFAKFPHFLVYLTHLPDPSRPIHARNTGALPVPFNEASDHCGQTCSMYGKEQRHTLGLRTTIGLPVPMEPLASSTLQVFAKASTKTAGSRAMTGEMVLKNDLTAIAEEGSPAQGPHIACCLPVGNLPLIACCAGCDHCRCISNRITLLTADTCVSTDCA